MQAHMKKKASWALFKNISVKCNNRSRLIYQEVTIVFGSLSKLRTNQSLTYQRLFVGVDKHLNYLTGMYFVLYIVP